MMHESRGKSIFLILVFICSKASGEMPMMQLSREEMVSIAGYGEEKLSSVLVIGTLICQACPKQASEPYTSHVAGAKIAVACKTEGGRREANRAQGTTDEYGEFMIDLPSHLHAIPMLEEACVVMVIGLPKRSTCHRHALRMSPMRIKLSSVGNGIRVYTAGDIKLNSRRLPTNECLRMGDHGGLESYGW